MSDSNIPFYRKLLIAIEINWRLNNSLKCSDFYDSWKQTFGIGQMLTKSTVESFLSLLNKTNGQCDAITFDVTKTDNIPSNNVDLCGHSNSSEISSENTNLQSKKGRKRIGKKSTEEILCADSKSDLNQKDQKQLDTRLDKIDEILKSNDEKERMKQEGNDVINSELQVPKKNKGKNKKTEDLNLPKRVSQRNLNKPKKQ